MSTTSTSKLQSNNLWLILQHSFSSVLLVSSIISLTLFVPLSVAAQDILTDYDNIIQRELKRVNSEVVFKNPIKLERAINFLQVNGVNQIVNSQGYGQIEFENSDITLDIPFTIDSKMSIAINQSNFQKNRTQVISDINTTIKNGYLKDNINIGEKQLSLEEAKIILGLKIQDNEPRISKLDFLTENNISLKFQKEGIKNSNAVGTKNNSLDSQTNQSVSEGEILFAKSVGLTQDQKNQSLQYAEKVKEGINRKINEKNITDVNKLEKQRRARLEDDKIIENKKRVEQMIVEGKQSQITNDDLYSIGKYSKELGLEPKIPTIPEYLRADFEKSQKIKQQQDIQIQQLLDITTNQSNQESSIIQKVSQVINGVFRFWNRG